MIARPYWITSQLAIVRRPQGGELLDDEMLALQEAGIDVVVSILEEEESRRAGLEREAFAAQAKGLKFLNFAVPDGGVPLDTTSFTEFLKDLESLLAHGKRIGIHCRASIGRPIDSIRRSARERLDTNLSCSGLRSSRYDRTAGLG